MYIHWSNAEKISGTTHCSKLMYLTTVVLESSTQTPQMSVEVRAKSTRVSWWQMQSHKQYFNSLFITWCTCWMINNNDQKPAWWRETRCDLGCSGCCRWQPAAGRWTVLSEGQPGRHTDRGQWWRRRPVSDDDPDLTNASLLYRPACTPTCQPPADMPAPGMRISWCSVSLCLSLICMTDIVWGLTLKDHIRSLWSWQSAKMKESSSSSLTAILSTRSAGLCSPRIAVGIQPDNLHIMELLFSSSTDTLPAPPPRTQSHYNCLLTDREQQESVTGNWFNVHASAVSRQTETTVLPCVSCGGSVTTMMPPAGEARA